MTHDPEAAASGAGPIPAWRLLLVAAMLVALYLAMPLAVTGAEVRPWLLTGVLVVGALIGVGMAYVAPARSSPEEAKTPPSSSVVRSMLIGLIGTGLILAQVLSTSGMAWLLLGCAALMAGGAGHAWMKARTSGGDGLDPR